MSKFLVASLNKSQDKKKFSCGVDVLDRYLQVQAGQDQRKRIAVTYALLDTQENKIAGYYTLSATAIELMDLPESIRKKLPAYPGMPATLIGRLAIDNAYKKQGLGELLLIDAVKRAYKTSLEVASFAIVVDAIDHYAEKFYKKYGFLNLSAQQNRLFLPMSVVAKL